MNVKKYLAAGIVALLLGVVSLALAQNQTSGESNSQSIATKCAANAGRWKKDLPL
jgi:hypothetical protein